MFVIFYTIPVRCRGFTNLSMEIFDDDGTVLGFFQFPSDQGLRDVTAIL